MSKGIKVVLFAAIILVVSVALGYVAVFFVFDTIADGRYELDKVVVGKEQIGSQSTEWQQYFDKAYVFEITGHNIVVYKDNSPEQKLHRLRGGLFSDRYIETKDANQDEWIRHDGKQQTDFEAWRMEQKQIVVKVYSSSGVLLQEWYYARI